MSNLTEEWQAAYQRAGLKHFEWLYERGVPRQGGPQWFGIDRVTASGDYYQPDPDGEPAIILPMTYGLGWDHLEDHFAPIDLVAMTSNGFYRRRGGWRFLNQEAIDKARHYKAPLTVFDNPMDWLRNRRQGAVILDWKRISPRFEFDGIPLIRCSPLVGKRLAKASQESARLPFKIEGYADAA